MDVIKYDDFTVYTKDNKYTFININIADETVLYESLFDYFFSEEKLLQYIENRKSVIFHPNKATYTRLYKHLLYYLDEENLTIDFEKLDEQIESILLVEGLVLYEDGKRIARGDKIGKIGEYIFSCILSDYFGFTCIIPKIHLVTDYNMSIFGIDELYLAGDMLLFGESKVCVNIRNGIELIKKSLSEYEKQIKDEYRLVLSNRFYGDKLQGFFEKYSEYTEVSVSFDEFVSEAGITEIGIPIFIAHGENVNAEYILNSLASIPEDNLLGLKTRYFMISLPVVDKYKMVASFTSQIRERLEGYQNKRDE